MLTKKEKRFFADIAWGASALSICEPGRGAALINGRQVQSYGFNKKIIKNKKWEISAIYDTVFGAKDIDMSNFILFSTYFPSLDDMILIVSVGISSVHFFGKITDMEAVEFTNSLKDDSIPLEIIQLEQ